jgi:Holliday junction resolvasome RuvABC endonuclease subunit
VATIGIDLSLTSPSLCVYSEGEFSLPRCTFYYLTGIKKSIVDSTQLQGELWPDYACDPQRYDIISTWVIDKIKHHNVKHAFIEGYAFNAVGRVFQIAENTGILKYKLWQHGIDCITVPPTVIKKYATGKGNANKEAIQTSFITETGFNLKDVLKLTDKQWNPSSDIIDSYYVCKYGVLEYGKNK